MNSFKTIGLFLSLILFSLAPAFAAVTFTLSPSQFSNQLEPNTTSFMSWSASGANSYVVGILPRGSFASIELGTSTNTLSSGRFRFRPTSSHLGTHQFAAHICDKFNQSDCQDRIVSVTVGFSTTNKFTLTVTITDQNGGLIESTPSGIFCGRGNTACSKEYNLGAPVSLAVIPALDYTFSGWSGDCFGTGCSLRMDGHRNVTATFVETNPTNELPVLFTGFAKPNPAKTGEAITFESEWDDPEKQSIIDVRARYRLSNTSDVWIEVSLDHVQGSLYDFQNIQQSVVINTAGSYEYQYRASDSDGGTTSWIPRGFFLVEDAVTPPVVNSVSPLTAQLNQSTTFTVSGSNLPNSLAFFIPECADLINLSRGSNTQLFQCTPSFTTGTKNGEVKDEPDGTLLYDFEVVVSTSTPTPVVTSVSPLTATLNQLTTFTINGSNLPDTLAFFIPECANLTNASRGASRQEFRCTPSFTTGVKDGLVKDQPDGTLLHNFEVVVSSIFTNQPPTIQTTGTPTSVVISGQTYSVTLSATDVDNNLQKIEFDWNDGSANEVESKLVSTNGQQVTFSRQFSQSNTSFNWSATAYDIDNGQSSPIGQQVYITCVNGDHGIGETLLSPVGQQFLSGDKFEAKWQITNCGTTTWDHYRVVHTDDSAFQGVQPGPHSFQIQGIIAPGQTTDIRVPMTAPDVAPFLSEWGLQQSINLAPFKTLPKVAITIKVPPSQVNTTDTTNNTVETVNESGTPVADPIDISSGAHLLNHQLLTLIGVINTNFSIHYNSLLLVEGVLGRGWGMSLAPNLELDAEGHATLHWTQNSQNRFFLNAEGQYNSPDRRTVYGSLQKNLDNSFTLTNKNRSVLQFDPNGLLSSQQNTKGHSLNYSYDNQQRLKRVIEPVTGHFLDFVYNSAGYLQSVSDALSRQVIFTYTDKDLTQITDADGNTTTYTYNDLGQVLTGEDHEGVVYFTNTYDADGRVKTQDDAIDGNEITTISYDTTTEPGVIISTLKDREGKIGVWRHTAQKQLLSIEDKLGKITVANTYDDKGNLKTSTDANNHTTTREYDLVGNLEKIIDAEGNTTTLTYDDQRNLTSIKDAKGKTTIFTYDASNNLKTITNSLGEVSTFTYNANNQLDKSTSPEGNVTRRVYENGLLKQLIDPEGNISSFSYDAAGRVDTITDAQGHVTKLGFDGNDRLISTTDALNQTVTQRYNSDGKVIESTDEKGQKTTFVYNGNGLLSESTDAKGNKTMYGYDGEDRLTSITDALNHKTTLVLDAKGRTKSIVDALGNTRTFEYDDADNIIKQIDGEGNTEARFTLDALDRVRKVTDALNRVNQVDYDELSRVTQSKDNLGRIQIYSYDLLDRLASVKDAIGGLSKQDYDKDGALKSLTDPNINTATIVRNKNSQPLSETNAAGNQIQFAYNARSLIKQIINARGQTKDITYDVLGRLKTTTDPDGTISVTYDKNGNVKTITEDGKTISRNYDELDRVTQYTNNRSESIGYVYDAVGNLKQLIYLDGKTVDYAYNAANLLSSVTDWAGRVTLYAYDANNRLKQTTRPNGSIQTRVYDVANQLKQIKDVAADGTIIVQYDLAYDAVGNIKSETAIPPQTAPDLSEQTPMTYGLDNQLKTYDGKAVDFDDDGNMIKVPVTGHPVTDLIFDSRNRLTQAGGITNRYDAENYRIATTDASGETRYTINPAELSQVVVKTDPDGSQTYYVYGLGLIGQEQAGIYRSYHYDLRGSTVALTDTSGVVVSRSSYDPFGQETSGSSFSTPFKYNGRDGVQTDSNGLYYMRARFYLPEIKRFVNRDVLTGTMVDGQSLNRFAYVGGNPVSFVDPLGLEKNASERNKYLDAYYNYFQQLDKDLKLARDDCFKNGNNCKTAGAFNGLGFIVGLADFRVFIDCKENPNLLDCGSSAIEVFPGGKLKKLVPKETKSLKNQAADLVSLNNGKHRVTLRSEKQQLEIDLAGKSHEGIPTPHTKVSPRNTQAPENLQPAFNTSNKHSTTRASTQEEIRAARKFLEMKNR